MKIQIKHRITENVIFETDAESLGAAIVAAVAAKADLSRADLSGANLSGANLSGADLEAILALRTIMPEGDLIGWKKLRGGVICKLRIPETAKRVGGMVGRKCRAEFAEVLEGSGFAMHDGTEYKVGKTIRPDSYDPNPMKECSHGIHFFITRKEAEDCQ